MDIPLNSSYFLTHACMIARATTNKSEKQIGTSTIHPFLVTALSPHLPILSQM
ncbi:MAG: hypothetical protein ACI9CE_003237 [Flavobacterium sp.]|jgi:hypothetical protein